MSAVSRICLRCRIRILSRGLTPRPINLCSLPRISARTYSNTKTPETTGERTKPALDAARSLEEEFPLADPVKVKLEGRLKPEAPWDQAGRRTTKGITTKDVEAFLSKVKKIKRRNEIDEALLPTHQDASKVDRTYEMLLSSKPPPRIPKQWVSQTGLRPPPEGLEQKFKYPRATHTIRQIINQPSNKKVVVYGYIKSVRKMNRNLVFLQLYDFLSGPGVTVQLVSNVSADASEERMEMQAGLSKLPPFVPVAVTGTIVKPVSPPAPDTLSPDESKRWSSSVLTGRPDIQLESLIQLNSVSPDLIYTPETVFPPEKRHLQLRTSPELARALSMRSLVSHQCRSILHKNGFLEVETPLLFKSTPEGAREFLVPTRNRSESGSGGMCYALPQSPQQYKQILMASGVAQYFQLAKCFRDEDLRADRQPEFTQLDLEMSFARQDDVIDIVQKLLAEIWRATLGVDIPYQFKRMTYREAMRMYGTDKPDLRFQKLRIHKVIFDDALEGRYSDLLAFYIRCNDTNLKAVKRFHEEFVAEHQVRSGPDRFMSYVAGEDTANGVPEHELSASDVEAINESLQLNEGDIVLLKAQFGQYTGGSTRLGQLRSAIISKAIAAEILRPPSGFEFVWITDFPLFSPVGDSEPGQSSTSGLTSTHHPFTAPHEEDFALLSTEPQRVRAEHYDLVVNGVELGGGSRRIHDPELQRYILEEIIKVHPDKIHQFDHLLDVLGSGCPPHAGIAIGFDRLIAVMMGTESVRDVIAFPKNNKGMDPLVKSPSLVTDAELETYGLQRM